MQKETIAERIARLKRENPPSEHIKDHYDVVGVVPGKVSFGGKQYDLRTISKKAADALVDKKFPYLQAKKPAAASNDSDKKK